MLTASSCRRADSVGGLSPHREACSGECAGDLGDDLATTAIAMTAPADRLSVSLHCLNNCVLTCSSTVSAFLSALFTLEVPVLRASLRFALCSYHLPLLR